jgi:beta-aspartyl-peptidase (threonine type)
MSDTRPVIIVHGGAWAVPEEMDSDTRSGVCRAAQEGYKVLQQKGSSLDAVEAAVKLMEDDPVFNAGKLL